MKKVLLYVLDEGRKKEVTELLNSINIEDILFLTENNINDYVGEFFDVEVDSKNAKNYEPPKDIEFMMLGNFDNDKVLEVLKVFRESKIKRPITCSLTETNVKWQFGELFEDLKKEDEYMKNKFEKKN